MKLSRFCLCFLLIVAISAKLFSQIACTDARNLRNELSGTTFSGEAARTLFKYISIPNFDNDDAKIRALNDSLKKNPFLKHYKIGGTQESALTMFGNLFKDVANTDVTTIADGFAKFLVNRTKEELSIAFFNEFKQVLNDPRYEDLRILFPATTSILNLIDKNIYQFSMYLTNLRDAFGVDLSNLPESFSFVIHQPKYQAFFDQPDHGALLHIFEIAAQTSSLIIYKNPGDTSKLKNAGNIIESLRPDFFFPMQNPLDKDINGSLKTLKLLSYSFKSADPSRTKQYWTSTDSAFLVLRDTTTFRIYMGLLYEQAGSIVFANDSLRSVMRRMATIAGIDSLRSSIFNFYTQLEAYSRLTNLYDDLSIGKVRADSLKEIKDSSYLLLYGIINSSLSIIEYGMLLPNQWSGKIDESIPGYISAFKSINQVYLYCNQKRYILAITALVNASDQVLQEAFKSSPKNGKYVKFVHCLNLYGTFITQVATAKSSDEVADIIDKTVLPTGSSYVKKHAVFNISLNAYTGLYYGQQRQATDQKFVSVAGVYAPLGIAASWGIVRPARKPPWSLSLFASIIDIGSIVSYRFTHYNDTIANDVHVRLGQIVSPGGHLVIGLPKWPVSIGAGFNWAPLITKVEKNEVAIQANNKTPLRWEIFAAVDIPLLHFYNKPR
jgi:hypothetical protein